MAKKRTAASSEVHLVVTDDMATELHVDQGAGRTNGSASPSGSTRLHNQLDMMTASLAACSAMFARSYLELDGDPGDIRVTVSLDTGSPPRLHRRVEISRAMSRAEIRRFTAALKDTELTISLRSVFKIQTVVEQTGNGSTDRSR